MNSPRRLGKGVMRKELLLVQSKFTLLNQLSEILIRMKVHIGQSSWQNSDRPNQLKQQSELISIKTPAPFITGNEFGYYFTNALEPGR
jgi:hypothetical protein